MPISTPQPPEQEFPAPAQPVQAKGPELETAPDSEPTNPPRPLEPESPTPPIDSPASVKNSLPDETSDEDEPAKIKKPSVEAGESVSLEDPNSPVSPSNSVDWEGTIQQANLDFITEVIDGQDTLVEPVRKRDSGLAFSGTMRILDSNGGARGELNLVDGLMHGEEIYFDEAGKVTERNLWENGVKTDP